MTLYSSSKGNAAYIKYGRDEILIDCGVSARAVERALRAVGSSLSRISAIFITHEHGDHIKGLEVVSKYVGAPIYAPENSCAYLEPAVCDPSRLIPLADLQTIGLFDTSVCAVKTPHDSLDSRGFRIKCGEEKLGYFTDIGHLSENVLRGLSGCRRAVVESNHDVNMLKNGSYPYHLKKRILGDNGHLSNDSCAKLLPHLAAHGTESVILAHLSEENNRPYIAYAASANSLCDSGVELADEKTGTPGFRLRVAPVSGIAELE